MRRRSRLKSPIKRLLAGERSFGRSLFRSDPTVGGRRPISVRLAASVAALVTLAVLVLAPIAPAAAQVTGQDSSDSGSVDDLDACPEDLETISSVSSEVRVVKVAGLLDPVVRGYILDELDAAEEAVRSGSEVIGLILWVNSRGSVLSDADYVSLAGRLRNSDIPVALWVGQAGSAALGGTAELATVAELVAVTPNSSIGATGERRLPAEWGEPFGEASDRMETAVFSAEEAVQAGFAVSPLSDTVSIGSFATLLDGFEVVRCLDDGSIVTVPTSQARLSGLPLLSQFFHTVASPEVAYLFFTMGMAILVFELFVAGVGIAGVLGAGLMIMGGYGLGSLPVRWWAVVLLILAMFYLAVDIQTNVPRYYTIVGIAVFIIGTWFLYDGVTMSWITGLAVIIGMLLYAYTGMPSMVRTRFSTPTIGRRWMIGEVGEALSSVDPEGTVKIRDVPWRAITNRATPVEAGGSVRVVGIDRLLLEVEPEEGGAKDYRTGR